MRLRGSGGNNTRCGGQEMQQCRVPFAEVRETAQCQGGERDIQVKQSTGEVRNFYFYFSFYVWYNSTLNSLISWKYYKLALISNIFALSEYKIWIIFFSHLFGN